MRPGNRRKTNGGLKISKERTKKVGTRSIYDLIHNSFDLTFWERVDYVRHHYVYYDGNYEYFHDENGKPNARKRYLNGLIVAILNERDDPSKLTDFNQQIMRWRKRIANTVDVKEIEDTILKLETITNDIDAKDFNNHGWKKELITNGMANADNVKNSVALIENFLKSKNNNLSSQSLLNLPFKKMKVLAKLWNRLDDKNYDYEELVKTGFTAFNARGKNPLSEQQQKEALSENALKQYDEDLRNAGKII